jgi:Cu-Zn family superoxide dismutase
MPTTAAVLAALIAAAAAAPAFASGLVAPMFLATPAGPGEPVGVVTIDAGPSGAVFTLALHGLPPGPHGFHVHANPSCAPGEKDGKAVPAGGAGAHLDPAMSGGHMGPTGAGHLGDLPLIMVDADGGAHGAVTAPRIKSLEDLRGRALMIHAGGDNYADTPAPLGGGGARLACGVIGN